MIQRRNRGDYYFSQRQEKKHLDRPLIHQEVLNQGSVKKRRVKTARKSSKQKRFDRTFGLVRGEKEKDDREDEKKPGFPSLRGEGTERVNLVGFRPAQEGKIWGGGGERGVANQGPPACVISVKQREKDTLTTQLPKRGGWGGMAREGIVVGNKNRNCGFNGKPN